MSETETAIQKALREASDALSDAQREAIASCDACMDAVCSLCGHEPCPGCVSERVICAECLRPFFDGLPLILRVPSYKRWDRTYYGRPHACELRVCCSAACQTRALLRRSRSA